MWPPTKYLRVPGVVSAPTRRYARAGGQVRRRVALRPGLEYQRRIERLHRSGLVIEVRQQRVVAGGRFIFGGLTVIIKG